MPRERTELTRKKNFLPQGKIFVLSYEGNESEPDYFEALKEELRYKDFTLHIESLRRDKSDTDSDPKHVFQKLKNTQSEFNFKKSDEFWMIIDKDRWELNEWVEKCEKENNFFIALSNPCFELWLLLHIFDLNNLSVEDENNILNNRRISRKRKYIDKFLSDNLQEGYNKNNIRPDRFIQKIDFAIKQAKELDKKDINKHIGSHNYKLIEKLLE